MQRQQIRRNRNKLKFRHIIKSVCIIPLKDSNMSTDTKHLLSQLLIYSKALCEQVDIEGGWITLPMTEQLREISLKNLDYRPVFGVSIPLSYPEVSHLDLYGICNQFPKGLFPALKSAGFHSGRTLDFLGESPLLPPWIDHVCALETLTSLAPLETVTTEVDFIPSALLPGMDPVFDFDRDQLVTGGRPLSYTSWVRSILASGGSKFTDLLTTIQSDTYEFITDPASIATFVTGTFLVLCMYLRYYHINSVMAKEGDDLSKYPPYVFGKVSPLAFGGDFVKAFGERTEDWITDLIDLSSHTFTRGYKKYKFLNPKGMAYSFDEAVKYANYVKNGDIKEINRFTPLAVAILTSLFGTYAIKWIAGRLLRGAQRVWDVSIGAFRWTMSELSKDLGMAPLEITDIIPSEVIDLSDIEKITFKEHFDVNRIKIRDITGILFTFYPVGSTNLKTIKFESDNVDLSIYTYKIDKPFKNIRSVLMTPRLFMTGALVHFTNVLKFALQGTRTNPAIITRTNVEENEKTIMRKIERLTITRCTLGVDLKWADVMRWFPNVQTVTLTGISTLNNIGEIKGVPRLTKIVINDSGPVTGEVLPAFRNVQNVDIVSKIDIENLKNLIVLENGNRGINPSITLNSKSV